MAKSSHRLSDEERAERRRQDRERLQRAAEELLSSEGWARWVRIRATFRSYSTGNCMLIALQAHERGIVPQHVAGFRAWLKLGRCVRKNGPALRIVAPVGVETARRGAPSDVTVGGRAGQQAHEHMFAWLASGTAPPVGASQPGAQHAVAGASSAALRVAYGDP